ncbi:hypothetical protein [Vibrio phage vB_VpaS_AL-2]|nr:hypothetical protein [Vibrio phage vB_VpaS_AL-2]
MRTAIHSLLNYSVYMPRRGGGATMGGFLWSPEMPHRLFISSDMFHPVHAYSMTLIQLIDVCTALRCISI